MTESGEMEDTESKREENKKERRRDWDVPSAAQNRGTLIFYLIASWFWYFNILSHLNFMAVDVFFFKEATPRFCISSHQIYFICISVYVSVYIFFWILRKSY